MRRTVPGFGVIGPRSGPEAAPVQLDADALVARSPQFRVDGDEPAIYQEASGLVDARKANAVHVALARARGA